MMRVAPSRLHWVLGIWFCLAATMAAGAAAQAQAQAQAQAPAEAWGMRNYAVEKPIYEALVAELEGKIAESDARVAQTAAERDAYWQDWSPDARGEARAWFERSTHYPSAAKRLIWAKDEREAAAARYRTILENGADVDFATDTEAGKARRERLWGAHIALLRREVAQRNEQAIFDGIELQAVKSYLGTLINRDLGMSVEEFAADTADDAWYVIRNHADKFWDELLKCAGKILIREGVRQALGRWAAEYKTPPEVPGVVSTPEGVAAECMSDMLRNSLVNALTAAMRKNFVDDMTGQGIAPEVAEYWWSSFILDGEAATGPNEPRVKPLVSAIYHRIGAAVEDVLAESDMEQSKELAKRALEIEAKARLANEVRAAALEAARTAQREGTHLAQQTLRLESVQRATQKLGPELYAKDYSLRFLEALDGVEMLLQQYNVYSSATESRETFDRAGKPLIDEYWEVMRCLEATKQATGAHMVLQFYRWPEATRREFFSTCGEAKEGANLAQARQMASQMVGLAQLASSSLSEVETHCAEGDARLRAADSAIARYESKLLSIAQRSNLFASIGMLFDGIVEDADSTMAEATRLAEETEKAKKETEAAAEQACRLAEEIRAAGDATLVRTKLDATVAAEAQARERASAAATAAGQTEAAAKQAISAAEQARELVLQLSIMNTDAAELDGAEAEVEAALLSAADEARANGKASQALARVGRDATVLANRARQLLGGPTQTAAIQQQLQWIEEMYAVVKATAARDSGCEKRLNTAIAALRERFDPLRLQATRFKADAQKVKAELGDSSSYADIWGYPDQARATADVAGAIAEAAASSAANAKTCLDLARAATEGQGAELVAAGRAALGQCDYLRAKDLIERLPAGRDRQDLADAYRASVTREQKTRALWDEADALYVQGDFDGAAARLDAALANTACDTYKSRIVEAIARIHAERNQVLEEAARSAIADCDFDEATGILTEMEEAKHPKAGEIDTALAAAMAREAQVDKLLAQAEELGDYADNDQIIAVLRQAQALTKCTTLQGDIAAAIANMRQAATTPGTPGPGSSQESGAGQDSGSGQEVGPGQGPGGTPSGTPGGPVTGRWEGPWRGALGLREFTVNGQAADPRAVAASLDGEWQSYLDRRRNAGSVLAPMEEDVGGRMKEMAKSGFMLLTGDLPISFVLIGEAGGYRLALPAMPAASARDPVLVQFVRSLPVLLPDGQGGWRAEMIDKGSSIVLSITAADAALTRVNLGLSMVFQKPDDVADAGASFNIRSLRMTLVGTADPGQIPYDGLVAEYGRLISERRMGLPLRRPMRGRHLRRLRAGTMGRCR